MILNFVPVVGVEYLSTIFGRERYDFMIPEFEPVDTA
jgi:hypothetical protein